MGHEIGGAHGQQQPVRQSAALEIGELVVMHPDDHRNPSRNRLGRHALAALELCDNEVWAEALEPLAEERDHQTFPPSVRQISIPPICQAELSARCQQSNGLVEADTRGVTSVDRYDGLAAMPTGTEQREQRMG